MQIFLALLLLLQAAWMEDHMMLEGLREEVISGFHSAHFFQVGRVSQVHQQEGKKCTTLPLSRCAL